MNAVCLNAEMVIQIQGKSNLAVGIQKNQDKNCKKNRKTFITLKNAMKVKTRNYN